MVIINLKQIIINRTMYYNNLWDFEWQNTFNNYNMKDC